jgi:hypothetical protein
MLKDITAVKSDDFASLCRLKSHYFTRRRKLPPGPLLLSVLARRGRSLALEVRDLYKASVIQGGISVAGYLKQRLKLNPAALLFLARHHAAHFYQDSDATVTYKGHLLLAIDGSTANVPTTPETLEIYGNTSSHGRPQAMCGLSCVFDVLNRQIVDLTITRGSFDERGQVPLHKDSVKEVIGKRPWILIADRGYPSLALLCELSKAHIPFVIRVTTTFLSPEFRAMKTDDEDVTVKLTAARCKWQRQKDLSVYRKLQKQSEIALRIVKLPFGQSGQERIVTNLSRKEFSTKDLAEIYRLRWEVETAFSVMKDKLQMENFTGTKPVLIEQDIFAVAYLINVVFDLAQDAERRLWEEKEARLSEYKHHMTINKTFAVGVVKDEIIHFVLAPDNLKEAIMAEVIKELSCHIVPVRQDRVYKRNKEVRCNRYSNTHKRAF